VYVDVLAKGYCSYGIDLTAVKQSIETVIEDTLSFDNRDLYEPVIKALVNSSVNAVSNLRYADVLLKVSDVAPYAESAPIVDYQLPIVPIARSEFEVYVDGAQVAEDNNLGTIVTEGSYTGPYTIASGSIDYATGIMSIDFDAYPPADAVVTVKYRQGKVHTKTIRNAIEQLHKVISLKTVDDPILASTVVISVDDIKIARDDGANSFEVYPGYIGPYQLDLGETNTINYNQGNITITLQEDLGRKAIIAIQYTQDRPSDDITIDKDKVAILNTRSVTMQYLQ
jgi:hypothetical protein